MGTDFNNDPFASSSRETGSSFGGFDSPGSFAGFGNSGSFDSPSGFGGFDNSNGFDSPGSFGGFDNSSGFGGAPSGGEGDMGRSQTSFSDQFKVNDPFQATGNEHMTRDDGRAPMQYANPAKKIRPPRMSRGSNGISRNALLTICGIAAALVLCIVFRNQISDFLEQLLTWVFSVILIIVLLRLFVFRRRRRW